MSEFLKESELTDRRKLIESFVKDSENGIGYDRIQ